MKIEEHKTEKKFEPITFTVTLESKEELASWYARMAVSLTSGPVETGAPFGATLNGEEDYDATIGMFNFLNEKWRELHGC